MAKTCKSEDEDTRRVHVVVGTACGGEGGAAPHPASLEEEGRAGHACEAGALRSMVAAAARRASLFIVPGALRRIRPTASKERDSAWSVGT